MELEEMCHGILLSIVRPLQDLLATKKLGIAIFLFDFGERGNLAYASTAKREDMVNVIHEWLAVVNPPSPPDQQS